MARYVALRVLLLIPILLCVTFIVYALVDMMPGSIADRIITGDMTDEEIQEIYELFDLDKPMLWRYGKYLWNLLHGDLGASQDTGLSVWYLFTSRWMNTVKLSLFSVALSIVIGIPVGIYAAKHAGTISDNLCTAGTMIFVSMPNFWLGLMLLTWFCYKVKLFPVTYDGTWKCFVLPVLAGGMAMSASLTRQTRSAILEVSRQDYLRTARAKGVPERTVTYKHELGNALIPIITNIGGAFSATLAGSAIIEEVYSWPGVGYMQVQAIRKRDAVLACGTAVLITALHTVILLLVDLVYAAVDPRIKAAYVSKGKKKKQKKVTT